MTKALIYGLRDPISREIRYIGKSTSGLKRPQDHFRADPREAHTRKSRWISRLERCGFRPAIEVLERVPDPGDLSDTERYWIAQAKGLGWPLTNLTEGGDGSPGRQMSPETKAKMSARRHSPETRAKLTALLLGHKMPEVTRLAIRAARLGSKHSAETRQRIANSLRGRKWTPEEHVSHKKGRQ